METTSSGKNRKRYSRRAAVVLLLGFAGAGGWALWKAQPWMGDGEAVKLGTWQSRGYTFEIWQRKNNETFRAFATGLFVKKPGGTWRVYLLGIQDPYSPSVKVEENGALVDIYYLGKKAAEFDPATDGYRRVATDKPYNVSEIKGEPPSNWWTKEWLSL